MSCHPCFISPHLSAQIRIITFHQFAEQQPTESSFSLENSYILDYSISCFKKTPQNNGDFHIWAFSNVNSFDASL